LADDSRKFLAVVAVERTLQVEQQVVIGLNLSAALRLSKGLSAMLEQPDLEGVWLPWMRRLSRTLARDAYGCTTLRYGLPT